MTLTVTSCSGSRLGPRSFCAREIGFAASTCDHARSSDYPQANSGH